MTTIEMEAKKARLVRSIMNIDSEDLINKLSGFVDSLTTMPCQHTIEELKEGLPDFFDKLKNGQLIAHENLKHKAE